MAARITVLLFATAREAVGASRLEWPVAGAGVPASSLVRGLAREYPRLAPILKTSRFVLNGRYLTRMTRRVRAGDEFAVHPPYGGG